MQCNSMNRRSCDTLGWDRQTGVACSCSRWGKGAEGDEVSVGVRTLEGTRRFRGVVGEEQWWRAV